MKNTLLILCFAIFVISCKTTTTEPAKTPTEILSLNAWKIDRLASKDNNKTLTSSDYGSQAIGLFILDYNFKSNNVVRAVDRVSKQILNTGTWSLMDNNATMNIDIEGFKGDFDVIELSQTKMVLRVKGTVKIAGLDNTVNMEFIPSL